MPAPTSPPPPFSSTPSSSTTPLSPARSGSRRGKNPSFRRPTPHISPPVIPTPSRNWNPDQWDWDSRAFCRQTSKAGWGESVTEAWRGRFCFGGGAGVGGDGEAEQAGAYRVAWEWRRLSDLSSGRLPCLFIRAKDYNRWHKVCEVHSKMTNALMGKVMQRFCQQCSRFHPLSEFDEGKRSSRRKLAGHNRQRRKSQHDDVSSRLAAPGS